MKKLQILLLPLLAFSLIACSTEEEKNILQAAFDKYNPTGNSAICVESNGIDLKQPYTTHNIELGIEDYDYLAKVNNWRNNRLVIFAELGLLNQQTTANGQFIYAPTELGLSYISERGDLFCFGRVVVTDIKYEKKQDGLKLYSYDFYLENVPDWAKDERLYKINRNIRSLANATLENGKNKWWGGTVFFTSDKQLGLGSDVGSWVY